MSEAVLDDLPDTLLRFYANEEHARLLAEEARLRMWALAYFKGVEGARADPSEGESHLLVPGDVTVVSIDTVDTTVQSVRSEPGHLNFLGSFVQPSYAFCSSCPTVDVGRLETAFGPHRVRILDPRAFGHALHEALERLSFPDGREILFLDGCRVRYDKGGIGQDPRTAVHRLRIHFAQKPPGFSGEEEYRFTAALSGSSQAAPDFLDVELDLPRSVFRVER